jgi:hypothetical protein
MHNNGKVFVDCLAIDRVALAGRTEADSGGRRLLSAKIDALPKV